jgi:glycosyltransferase involved in cell wall biosynthesis
VTVRTHPGVDAEQNPAGGDYRSTVLSLLMISPNHFTRWGGPRGTRSRRIAAALAARGWQVRLAVVDGPREPTDPGIEVAASLPGPPTDPHTTRPHPHRVRRSWLVRPLRRLLPCPDTYAPWSIRVWRNLRDTEGPDIVYVLAWPFSTIPAGAALARRFGVPLVIDLGDPWEHRGLGMRTLERASMRAATAIIVTSTGIAEVYRERTSLGSDRIVVVPNGADLAFATSSRRRRPLFLSLGTISESRTDPVPGFRALRELHREGRIEFNFYGRVWRELPADVLDSYRGVVPAAEAALLTRSADAIVIVGNRDARQIPSKVFEMARSDIPVLYLRGPVGEPGARLLMDTGHATVAPGSDAHACRGAAAEVIARLENGARPQPTHQYSWEDTVDRITELLDRVLAAKANGRVFVASER